jgi:S-adenosylmethionine hydrolase
VKSDKFAPKLSNYSLTTITLLTDFAESTHYVMRIKASLLNEMGNVPVLDISHYIHRSDIRQGMYVLDNACKTLKNNSIHLFGVNNGTHRHIAAQEGDVWYLSPDHGVLPEMLKGKKVDYYVMEQSAHPLFVERLYVQYAARIAQHEWPLPDTPTATPYQTIFSTYSYQANQVQIQLAFIDVKGNCILSYKREDFNRMVGRHRFTLYLNESDTIEQLSEMDNPPGNAQLYAYFNVSGYLEIAYSGGHGARLFGMAEQGYVVMVIHQT